MKITSLLMANRGEITVRVVKTARRMGIRAIAMFAGTDRHAPHVTMADTAISLGKGPVSNTYLDIDKIINAMQTTGADAIHPGYGFLSENAGFAGRVQADGFIWIRPPTNTKQAKLIGFPLLVQASAGVGGKGMRVVATENGNDTTGTGERSTDRHALVQE